MGKTLVDIRLLLGKIQLMGATFDALGIVTADMKRSHEFYAMLGVPVPDELEDHTEATLATGIRLMWDTEELIRQIQPGWQKPTGHRLGLAFRCESPADVDAIFARVTEAGFRGAKAPWDAFWGQRYAQLLDPDDNIVDLFAPL